MQVSSVDRFIPARRFGDLEVASYNLSHSKAESDILLSQCNYDPEDRKLFFNTAQYANNIIHYRTLLRSAMGLTHSKVLNYSISNMRSRCNRIPQIKNSWPVIPRKKPLIHSPTMVLDMPDIDTNINHHVIDWGKKGQIATIFHGEVHLWVSMSSSSQLACTQINRSIRRCVRWNRSGTKFAVSRTRSRISIIDAETFKIDRTVRILGCSITAIEWTKDDTIIAGCSDGSLVCIYNNCLKTSHFYEFFTTEVIDLTFSCNDNYLLARTFEGLTLIFKWPLTANSMLHGIFKYENGGYEIKSTSWHPWNESILAVGELDNGITIWNINQHKILDYKVTKPIFLESCFLECLTFNPLSAELLVSFYDANPNPDSDTGNHFLTVFSNLHTRVDEIQFHLGRVPYILWDGTGTKLATVGADESLVIWNFFGSDTDTEKKMLSKNQKKPKKDILEISNKFTCIR